MKPFMKGFLKGLRIIVFYLLLYVVLNFLFPYFKSVIDSISIISWIIGIIYVIKKYNLTGGWTLMALLFGPFSLPFILGKQEKEK